MVSILRACPSFLALALQGGVTLFSADLFVLTLADGVTTYYWTSWAKDLDYSGQTYSSKKPWINRSKWDVKNTMEVSNMAIRLLALNDDFQGGGNIKTQIHNGLFDGASVTVARAYMQTPDDADTLGAIPLFGGDIAGIDLIGTSAKIMAKSRNNKLDQYAPRNIWKIPCNHAFCDVGCTLSRAAFTFAYVVDTSPTTTFIPWTSAPGSPGNYVGGTLVMTSGALSGSRRNIVLADSSGLTLAYPLFAVPDPGDTFTAFEGCDKTYNSGSGQSCTDRANTQHYKGFRFIPPPTTAL